MNHSNIQERINISMERARKRQIEEEKNREYINKMEKLNIIAIERKKLAHQQYITTHKEAIKRAHHKYNNKESSKKKYAEYRKKYYNEKKAIFAQNNKEYYKLHKERLNERARINYHKHKQQRLLLD